MAKHGHIKLEDDRAARLHKPEFAAAYRTRRTIHEIALAVRALREQAGLSQAELAALVGTKQPAIARLETSQLHAPRWDVLERIAGALGKQLQLSFVEPGDKPPVRVERMPRRRQREEQAAK